MNQLLLLTLVVLLFIVFLILLLGKIFIRSIDPSGKYYSIDKWDKALIAAVILCIAVAATLFVIESGGSHITANSADQDTSSKNSKLSKDLLAKYGYELDTSSKGIAGVLRDSLKINALIIKEAIPDFGLQAGAGIKVDSISSSNFFLALKFMVKHAPATGIVVRTVPGILFDETLHVIPDPGNNYFYMRIGDTLAADGVRSILLNIPYTTKGVIYFLLTGMVANISGTQNHVVRKIYWIDTDTKQVGEALDAHYKLIDNFYIKLGFK